MIEKIEIKNFKSIKYLNINKLNKITIIGGKNNCGKTTLLESIFTIFDRSNNAIFLRQASLRGIPVLPNEPKFIWGPFFYNFDMSKIIEINSIYNKVKKGVKIIIEDNKNVNFQMKKKLNANYIKTNDISIIDKIVNIKFFDNGKIVEESITAIERNGNMDFKFNQGPSKKRDIIVYIPARIQSNPSEDSDRLSRLEIEYNTQEIIEVLRSVSPEIKNIKTISIGQSACIYADIGQQNLVPFPYLGDGITRLLTIVLAMTTCKNSTLLVDEIENGLHHSVLKNIWNSLYEASQIFNCQIICTTHSHECLAAANNALINTNCDIGYIRLNNNNNEISSKYFDKELLHHAIESDMEIR